MMLDFIEPVHIFPILYFLYCFVLFETGSWYLAQAGNFRPPILPLKQICRVAVNLKLKLVGKVETE
jgi:hypothetical protein